MSEPVPAQMRAARYHRFGPPSVLQVDAVPTPVPARRQVLVRVAATAVAGGEVVMRGGGLPVPVGRRFPLGVGLELAGTVVAEGPGSPDLHPGDRVWGVLPRSAAIAPAGSAAQYVAVDPGRLGIVPEQLTLVEAAGLPGTGTTAVTALIDHLRLRAGQSLLVRGGVGGVGSIAVQLGHALGARVSALAGAATLDAVRELGADEVFDYRTTAIDDLDRFDAVLDTVGAGGLHRLQGRVKAGGRLVTIAPTTPSDLGYVLISTLVWGTRRARFFSGNVKRRDLDVLAAYVRRGDIRPVVASVRPLHQIADAHQAMEDGGVLGRHHVTIDHESDPPLPTYGPALQQPSTRPLVRWLS